MTQMVLIEEEGSGRLEGWFAERRITVPKDGNELFGHSF
jgi:hypothetical protein